MKTKAKQLAMLITDAGIIADITNPSNWNYATYTGSLTGLEVNQYYYDGVYEYKFDGAILYRTNTITGMPMNELVINENDQEIYGKQFQSFANAISWIMATSVPTVYNRRAIRFSGYNTEDVALPEYVYLVGNGEFTSFLMGAISFLGTGQTLGGNCIFNCTAMNLVIDNSTLTPIYITPTTNPNTPAYAPRILEYTVTSAPVSGTYQLEIDTHTYVFNWNDDATVIQAAIRADYPQAVVNIPTMFDFMIYMVGLPAPQGAPNYGTLYRSAYNIDMVNAIGQTVDLNNTFTEGNIQVQEISLDNTPTQGAYQFAITYGSNLYGSNVLNWDADEATILTEIRNILHQAEVAEGLNLGSADTQIVGTALTTDISIILNNACQAIPEIDIVANTLASYPPIQVNLYRCNINVSSNVGGNQYGFFDSQLLGGDLSQANSQFNNCQIKSYYSDLSLNNPIIYNSVFASVDTTSYLFAMQSPLIYNSVGQGCNNITWGDRVNSSNIEAYNSKFQREMTLNNAMYMNVMQSNFDSMFFVNNNNSELDSYNCVFVVGVDTSGGGSWTNQGENFDNRNTDLQNTDMQNVTKELNDKINQSNRLVNGTTNIVNLLGGTGSTTTIYTVPKGKKFIITQFIIKMETSSGFLTYPSVRLQIRSSGLSLTLQRPLSISTVGNMQLISPEGNGYPTGGFPIVGDLEQIDFKIVSGGSSSGADCTASILLFGILI